MNPFSMAFSSSKDRFWNSLLGLKVPSPLEQEPVRRTRKMKRGVCGLVLNCGWLYRIKADKETDVLLVQLRKRF